MAVAATDEKQNQGWTSFQTEVDRLRDAVVRGDLKRRLVPESHAGDVATACLAVNEILDTVVQYLDKTVSSVDGMCIGQIPKPFEDGFPGDFARAKKVCNDFIDVINRRNSQIALMTKAAASGDLHVRADVEAVHRRQPPHLRGIQLDVRRLAGPGRGDRTSADGAGEDGPDGASHGPL